MSSTQQTDEQSCSSLLRVSDLALAQEAVICRFVAASVKKRGAEFPLETKAVKSLVACYMHQYESSFIPHRLSPD